MEGMRPAELIVILVLLSIFGLWVSALISVAKRTDLPTNSKVLWIVFLLLFGFATAIIYWIIRLATKNKGVPAVKTFD